MKTWRVWLSAPLPGPQNMAWDEALFRSSATTPDGVPVLRFYSWLPYSLSLGRFQNPELGLNPRRPKLPVVRRSTGGGAIWHANELTYSLSCHKDHLQTPTVKASFELLAGFLLDTWKSFGWSAGWAKDQISGPSLGQVTASCFAGKEEYDILVGNKKMGGNAQRRQGGSIFQHGSIPIELDWALLQEIFDPASCPTESEVTDLRTLGWQGTLEELTRILAEHFGRRLGVELQPWEPSEHESRLYEEALVTYLDSEWTKSGRGAVRDRIHIASP